MKPTRRFRWPRPQFSIGNLLMLMAVVGLSLAWYDQRLKLDERAATIAAQQRAIMRLTVNGILRRHATDEDKAAELRPLVKLGEPIETIELWSGPRIDAPDLVGPDTFMFADCDLVVQCDAAGIVRSFGYQRWTARRCEAYRLYTPVASLDAPQSAEPQGILSQRNDKAGGMR